MKRAQGCGSGTNMMKTILSILKSKGTVIMCSPALGLLTQCHVIVIINDHCFLTGVCGVHLEMSSKNYRAFKFYRKLGFTLVDLEEEKPPSGVLVLGKCL